MMMRMDFLHSYKYVQIEMMSDKNNFQLLDHIINHRENPMCGVVVVVVAFERFEECMVVFGRVFD
jgi:hypothetical protein